ncbi:MAG TPA: hypothetical protein PKU89_00695 [Kiritimatiellia bacterium]|nr:hypothetical protein [Kiritimatiellia bacterium]
MGTVLLLRLGVGKPGAGLLLAWQELPTYAAFLGLAWWQLRGLQERGIHLLRAPLAWALALNPVLLLGAPPWRGVGIVLALLAATEIGLGGIGSLICRRRRG